MGPSAVLSASIPSAFAIPVAIGASLVGSAAVVTLREFRATRRPAVIGGAVLGATGVVAQLAATVPTSRLGFVLGTGGGWCWYVAWQYSQRRDRLPAQTLAVGGLLWIGGTITLAVTVSGTGWPINWSVLGGITATVGSIARSWHRRGVARVDQEELPVIGVFLLPAIVGAAFGSELLFVLFVIAVVVGVIGWSLLRLEQARRYRN